MPDDAPQTWKQRWGPAALKVAAYALTALLSALATYLGLPAPPPLVVEVPVEVPPPPGGYAQTFGWYKDPSVIADNLDPAATPQFDATPAGRAALGDEDVFLWRAVRKAGGFPDAAYPNVNQQNVGCCVGCGWKHGVDALMAVQILAGRPATWKPVSVEVIYGGSRVEVGGGRISGDGSVGAWAAKWVKEWGVVPMEKFPEADLAAFSPARAREFGRRGVPDALEPVAREHPVKSTALVKSWADVKRAVGQGYPVVICSDRGFRMDRDATGRAAAQGSWAHCMVCLGVRGGADEGGFILNSWGDHAHTGPVWPPDMPPAGFWADARVIETMVRQGDSFAISDATGFPSRKLDWLIRADPRIRPADVLALRPGRPEFALAP